MTTCTTTTSTWTTQGRRETLAAGHRKLGYVDTLQGGFALVASVYDSAGRRHQRPFYDRADARNWVEENAAS